EIRTFGSDESSASESITCTISGLPQIGTMHLWLTPARSASGLTSPARCAARTRTVVMPLVQLVPPQPLGDDRFDQVFLRPAHQLGRAAIALLRPQVALQVDLEQVDCAGLLVEAEFEAAVVERPEYLGQFERHRLDLRPGLGAFERHKLVFRRAVDEIALFVV